MWSRIICAQKRTASSRDNNKSQVLFSKNRKCSTRKRGLDSAAQQVVTSSSESKLVTVTAVVVRVESSLHSS